MKFPPQSKMLLAVAVAMTYWLLVFSHRRELAQFARSSGVGGSQYQKANP